jgi:hypothetical protein
MTIHKRLVTTHVRGTWASGGGSPRQQPRQSHDFEGSKRTEQNLDSFPIPARETLEICTCSGKLPCFGASLGTRLGARLVLFPCDHTQASRGRHQASLPLSVIGERLKLVGLAQTLGVALQLELQFTMPRVTVAVAAFVWATGTSIAAGGRLTPEDLEPLQRILDEKAELWNTSFSVGPFAPMRSMH